MSGTRVARFGVATLQRADERRAMNIQIVQEGRHVYVHPEQAHELLKLTPWRRHAVYLEFCRNFYRPRRRPKPTQLAKTGVEAFRKLLGVNEAADLSRMVGTALEKRGTDDGAFGPLPQTPEEPNVRVLGDAPLEQAVSRCLKKIFCPRLASALEAYFDSYFRIDHLSIFRTHPVKKPLVSFLWHRDFVPMTQVHVMVYLTPGGDGGGETHFLDIEQTREAAIAGYHYITIADRIDDISKVLKKRNVAAKIVRPTLKPGDAVVFGSPRVLHRGLLPETRYRDTMIFILLPSAVPWNYEIEDFGATHLFVRTDKDTLNTNPFLKFCPLDPHIDVGRTEKSLEPWAALGHMMP